MQLASRPGRQLASKTVQEWQNQPNFKLAQVAPFTSIRGELAPVSEEIPRQTVRKTYLLFAQIFAQKTSLSGKFLPLVALCCHMQKLGKKCISINVYGVLMNSLGKWRRGGDSNS